MRTTCTKFKAAMSLLLLSSFSAVAQTDTSDLSSMLDNNPDKAAKEYTYGAFKTTRVINSHSIENTAKGTLDFKISHRFSSMSGGVHEFFGLDGATIRLGLDYGVTNWLTVGVGRSSLYKEYDGYVKAKLLRQTVHNEMPLSLSYVGGMSLTSMSAPLLLGRPLVSPEKYPFSNRLFFFNQLLIARKLSNTFTVQLMPTHVHYNFVNTIAEPNDIYALGAAGRIKLSRRTTLNLEYFYQFNQLTGTTNSLSIGFDIETGGHVFQLHFTNSNGMTERTFIGQTNDKWEDGHFRFGFNIARVFTIVKPKDFENSRNKIW
ncbi:MAG TPA: DUF5777 family beta-barrel protein [Chitinophagaceae bacterium]|nr:DUF5777 family beta-barrel protein [Chitinophagaceae bacterium]